MDLDLKVQETPGAFVMAETVPTNGEHGSSTKKQEGVEEETRGRKLPSPLLTARKVATFEEVHLGDGEDKEERGRTTPQTSAHPSRSQSRSSVPPMPPRSESQTLNPPAQHSFSASWGGSQLPKPQMSTSMGRKLSSPFTWLSKKKSVVAGDKSPPLMGPRRNTTAIFHHSSGSNADTALGRLDEERSPTGPTHKLPPKEILKEQFKLLRMREEAGIDLEAAEHKEALDDEPGTGLGIGASEKVLEGEDDVIVNTPARTNTHDSTAGLKSTRPRHDSTISNVDRNLAPGTVSGMSAGPSAMQDPAALVDWDLWQNLVYEGPAAVAKTSAAELNRAIASGIPSAIRGVVWQVLANSKNDDLEGVYRELVVRGTDKEKELPSPNLSNGPNSGNSFHSNGTVKDSLTSSSSSTHSENSTAATTANVMVSPSPSHSIDVEGAVRLQATMAAERHKKAKEDLAALKKLEKTIRKDLGGRTNYSKYTSAAGLQESLFGVCKAYALYDEGVGYAQGINFIVMPLLFNMSEEEAFCLLVRLMTHYNLRNMFTADMQGLHLHLDQFSRLLEDHNPALYYHLRKRDANPSLYATQWFLTLFAYKLPLQLVLRVYDLILSEGLESAILKFGIALVQKNADALLKLEDIGALKTFLNERLFDAYIDPAPSAGSILESGFFGSSGGIDKDVYRADLLVQEACAVHVDPDTLKSYTVEYETRKKVEKDREDELELLRNTATSSTAKIRNLEERAQKSDADHVQMATGMVHSKMQNAELQDTNEALRVEVQELKKLVESQPAEVEAKLKEEMERIMERNVEVQGENRVLEEEMSAMEQRLVTTSLELAQLNSEHETLKQKWNDMKRMLGDTAA